ncbi:ankyrin repeat domain-containing protein [Thalassotalea sp. G20_0]|uniref:ankyrin repeat domain-containing protein n=1 Tax=Thalassotalea sp. G20_0 TaxID=2821093 RepID=UPI001ADD16A7|nr:ankyrin repeat domain-containing protein [Thalassotalea sp. G20_0]MBO9494498.1 ankyrin repeat domain-containing protein [Thalassotalea sp. G20_0]
MYYSVGNPVTTVPDTDSFATTTNPQNQIPDTTTDNGAHGNSGDFDNRHIYESLSSTSLFDLPDSQSPPPQARSIGQRTMLPHPVNSTITTPPGGQETGHATADEYQLPSDPPPAYHDSSDLPYFNLPTYDQLFPLFSVHETNMAMPRPEEDEINENPFPDELVGACALPPITAKPLNPDEFNNIYFHACLSDDIETIFQLCQAAKPKSMNNFLTHPDNPTISVHPLHLAAERNQHRVLRFLCQNPYININARGPEKNTALHFAIRMHQGAAVHFLCQQPNIDVNVENSLGCTPIILACEKNSDVRILQTLLEKKPYLGPNKNGETALSHSVKNNNLKTTEILIYNGAAPVDTMHSDGKDSIFYISFTNASDQISILLLSCLTDINQKISEAEARVLHLAALTGKDDIITYLIDRRKASKSLTNKYGSMAVHYAAHANNATTLRRLIDHGCTLFVRKGRIEKDFWKKKIIDGRYTQEIDFTRANKSNGEKLFNHGGTPLEIYEGDKVQMINYEKKHGIKNNEKDTKPITIFQKLAQKLQILPTEKPEKTTEAVASTDTTPSALPVPEQPIQGSDHPAFANPHTSGDETNRNPENIDPDDVCGASALPTIMQAPLSRDDFNITYYNACVEGDLDTIKRLKQTHPQLMIDSLRDPNDPEVLLHPLPLAALNNQWAVLEFLCKLDGIHINARMRDGNTALSLAVRMNNQDAILFLCHQPGIDVNVSDSKRNTPVTTACELNLNDQVIDALLVNPKQGRIRYAHTALYFSVKNNNLNTTEKLLNAGAFSDRCYKYATDSLLYFSFTHANDDISKLLLKNMPNINSAISENGTCALHLICDLGKHTLISYLIHDLGASKFIETKLRSKPVHYAAHKDNKETLIELIKHGCTLKEGRGKIEDEFWPQSMGAMYAGGCYIPPRINYKKYNKSNGEDLHYYGGTPLEFYGQDIEELKDLEASLDINIKEEKKKDRKSMEEKKLNLKQKK